MNKGTDINVGSIEEDIKRCEKLTKPQNANWIGITNQKAIETVLNMLKENSAEIHQKNTELAEKNAEIEKYKKLLADNLARNLNDSIKAKEKADTDLDDLDKGWKVELEKKDKMIDLMAVEIGDISNNSYCNSTKECNDEACKNCIKEYFERKVEDARN